MPIHVTYLCGHYVHQKGHPLISNLPRIFKHDQLCGEVLASAYRQATTTITFFLSSKGACLQPTAVAAALAATAAAAAEAREILKPTKYHGKSFQSLIVFHEILKTAPRRSHAIHFRYGSKSGSYCYSVPSDYQRIWLGKANMPPPLLCFGWGLYGHFLGIKMQP